MGSAMSSVQESRLRSPSERAGEKFLTRRQMRASIAK